MGLKDTKVKRPVLRVSTQYFSCPDEDDAEKIADALTEDDPEAAAEAIAAAERELSAMEDRKTLQWMYDTATRDTFNFMLTNLVAPDAEHMFYWIIDKRLVPALPDEDSATP